MPPIRIGTTHMLHWDNRPQQQVFAEGVERMVVAEELGFWSAWVTEHHFANDPEYLPYDAPEARYPAYDLVSDPLTFLSHVAGRTSRIRLGTGVLVVPYDDPLRIAERAAIVDQLSGGRLELGIGRGSGFREPAVFHVADGDTSRRKYHESLEIIFKAWTGEPFAFEGEFFSFPEIKVVPEPLQRPHPPLFLGSVSEDTLTIAAGRGIPYASVRGAWGAASLEEHKRTADFYRQAAAERGVDISNLYFPHVLTMYCAPTDAEAAEVAEEYLRHFTLMIEAHYERVRRLDQATVFGLTSTSDLAAVSQLARKLLETNIIGSPATCLERIRALVDEIDLNYLLAFPDFGGIPHDKVLASMRLFAREVLPEVPDLKLSTPVR
jgi:alkanesulfonate monooxygenase SsuD/methylene tetrahydromethanopterin reductase-like flavin-dependent oxidoreductase (luciferase family)